MLVAEAGGIGFGIALTIRGRKQKKEPEKALEKKVPVEEPPTLGLLQIMEKGDSYLKEDGK